MKKIISSNTRKTHTLPKERKYNISLIFKDYLRATALREDMSTSI